MATDIKDAHNPSFVLLPVNNNRTAWRPFGLPVVMVVPHKRDAAGNTIPNSGVFNVRIYIEDVPQEARVAGHQNIGRRYPDKELYAETVDSLELAERIIDVPNLTITRDGVEIPYEEAQSYDLIHYTTSTGISDTIPFLVGADYYDLSDILIEVELLPTDYYNLVYETGYFKRISSADGRNDFLCVDANVSALALFKFQINHPGRVLEEFYRLTPPPYLTNASKAQDTTVALYRPLTDLLQDITDEQTLLERINWVFDAPAEAIPYLSSLLGWDIPYFPESLDQLRRAMLRRTVEFQNLKGSRRAIINIFRLFGFEILISNLWWSSDGLRLIRPDEQLPIGYENQEITTVAVDQVDALLANYEVTDFTGLLIPLLYRPQQKNGLDEFTALLDSGHITVTFYAVAEDSEAQAALDGIVAQIAADPAGWGSTAGCEIDGDGFNCSQAITDALAGKELAGYSQFQINNKMGDASHEIIAGKHIPVRTSGLSFNRETNNLTVIFNGFSELIGLKVYGFATYERFEFRVPDVIKHLQSNRFDLQILTQALDEFADPVTMEFAVEFLYKLKAFHSLLNVIRTRIELTETYQVTDICVGGDFEQRFDTDIGRIQVPPAIIPKIPGDLSDCSQLDAKSLGYKDSDIQYRIRILTSLPEEHAAWKALDGRDSTPSDDSNLTPNQPTPGRDECQFTAYGQDRKTTELRVEGWGTQNNPLSTSNSDASGFNPELNIAGQSTTTNSDSGAFGSFMREYREVPEAFCTLDNVTDYCYKGRVEDEILYRPTFIGTEPSGIKPVYIGMGIGTYWLFPALTRQILPGVRNKDSRSQTVKMRFSGKAPEATRYYFAEGVQGPFLDQPYDVPQEKDKQSFLGRLYRDYGFPTAETLHFSNRGGSPNVDQKYQLALQRPNLEIVKPTLHLPGCRFPTLNKLKDDFTSDVYEARPWDDNVCGVKNVCGKTDPDFLNFTMTVGTDGNEYLVFDDEPYTVLGNNLEADIPSLGEQTGTIFAEGDVVHKVYLEDAESNPAVSFDSVVGHDSAVGDGKVDTDNPLFSSHMACGTDVSLYTDFADGYPAVVGFQDHPGVEATVYDTLLSGLGLPDGAATGQQVLFQLSSGIRDGLKGYRLDAGCLLADCDQTNEMSTICATDTYLDSDGEWDFDPDHLVIGARLVLDEGFTAELTLLDGTIPTLLETF